VFSKRTAWDYAESPMALAIRDRRAAAQPLFDLTASNPTDCGFTLDAQAVLAPLAHAGALAYVPVPFGRSSAREAVSAYYGDHGAQIPIENLCLTTSTSEGYSFLFRLLCDPGDAVLIASPSYPLFSYLAALHDVQLIEYPLFYDHGWQIEPGAVEARITPQTRAIVLVHPNNPTGHFVSEPERAALEQLCIRHGLALIVDEVFLDYPWPTESAHPTSPASFATGPHPALTFVLSGLSKISALPQMKASWIATFGPDELLKPAQGRLEVIADTFLSMNAPVQQALPVWLAARHGIQQQVRERVCVNLATLDSLLQQGIESPVSRLAGEGGWYAVLRIPANLADEDLAIALLADTGVLIHPGSAFGFPPKGWLVLSLLTPNARFQEATTHMLEWMMRHAAMEAAQPQA
jgi:alanine-synthesizing transaminase